MWRQPRQGESCWCLVGMEGYIDGLCFMMPSHRMGWRGARTVSRKIGRNPEWGWKKKIFRGRTGRNPEAAKNQRWEFPHAQSTLRAAGRRHLGFFRWALGALCAGCPSSCNPPVSFLGHVRETGSSRVPSNGLTLHG